MDIPNRGIKSEGTLRKYKAERSRGGLKKSAPDMGSDLIKKSNGREEGTHPGKSGGGESLGGVCGLVNVGKKKPCWGGGLN